MNTAELIARESIRDLVARYNALGDRGRSDEVAALFAPEGTLTFDAVDDESRSTGREEITARLEAFKADFAERLSRSSGPGRLFHGVTTHVIEVVDDVHATGRSYVTVLSDDGLFEWGQYLDEYVRIDEGWRFASRRARRFGIVA